MRSLITMVGLCASAAVAQGGVWGGYVTGWQSSPTFVNRYVGNTQVVRPTLVAPSYGYGYGYVWPTHSSFHDDEEIEQQREQARAAQQQAIATQQAQLEAERERARLAEAQSLAQQQQMLAQQQQMLAQQQQALMEEQARLAARETEAKVQQAELERQALADHEAQRVRAEEAARPREKGPEIHRWVDEAGVVHYSTKPRR